MLAKVSAFVVTVSLVSPPVHAENNPLWWHGHEKLADGISTGLVVFNVGAETIASLRADSKRRALGCQALRTGIVIGTAELAKALINRTRPDGSDRKSFFSEHTGLSGVNSGWNFEIGFSVTLGTGFGRMAADKHYPTDVIVGGAVGFLARKACTGS